MGHFYGTLAAARCLGRAGVRVTLAEGDRLAPAGWSRYVNRRVSCPPVHDTDAFLSWLHAFGAAEPGHVLLPPSDDLAWLFAEDEAALRRSFVMLPTSLTTVEALLDKRALLEHCRAVGLDVPDTWFPASVEEAVTLGAEAGFPLVIKPRLQVLHRSGLKGLLIEDPIALREGYGRTVASDVYGERLRARRPDVVWPMLQRYYPAARESIYSLSGYAGAGGALLAVRAARKILQRPRKLGIGLCFEEAVVDEGLAARVEALCRRVGYQGVFEVELIEVGDRALVIDFNPRFYSQMAFDIDRGLPLPRLAYADAAGDEAGLAALVAAARAPRPPRGQVYCHRFLFELMLDGQRLSGHLDAAGARRWRRWWDEHRAAATDAVADPGDQLPWGADVVSHLASFARHPRSFVRSMVLDR
jgi:predicted ATP-grasp superfamily ATP-dependent carboligase